MPRPKKSDNDFFSELAHSMDGATLDEGVSVPYYVDTGNLAVNHALSGRFINGGVAGGKITEIYGPESSGKSMWGTNIMRGTQAINGIGVYLDCENSLNGEFAAMASHLDITRVVAFRPETLEAAFLKIYNIIRLVREKKGKEIPLVIVYDSLSASPCERELRETTVSEKVTQAEWKKKVGSKEQPGERAKICSKEFRKLETLLQKTNTTLFVINQTRMKIGVVYGDPIVTAGGGESLKFYAGCRIKTSTARKIENAKLETVIGVNLKLKCVKNKCFRPYWDAEDIELYFDRGVNPLSGLLVCLEKAERIERTGPGRYKVKEPWAGGKEVKFQASKAKNMVDAEVLYQCPSLVDAKTEEEVRAYLDIFKDAISMSLSDDKTEKEVKDQDDLLAQDDYVPHTDEE